MASKQQLLMEDFKGYATILCLNMLLDLKCPAEADRLGLVDQIVDSWTKGLKKQLQQEAATLHVAPAEGMDVEECHARYVKEIELAGAGIKRILNGK
jgi:hypothetical protein